MVPAVLAVLAVPIPAVLASTRDSSDSSGFMRFQNRKKRINCTGTASTCIKSQCGSLPKIVMIPAVLAVPIPECTAVLCGFDVVLILVWNRIEPQCGFMRFQRFYSDNCPCLNQNNVGSNFLLISILELR